MRKARAGSCIIISWWWNTDSRRHHKLPNKFGLSRPSSNCACPPAERTQRKDLQRT